MSLSETWDSLAFEKHIQSIFVQKGYQVSPNHNQNQPGYDFISTKNGQQYAVQVKAWKKRIPANVVGSFLEFCEANHFKNGILVSLQGFTDSSHALALADGHKRIFLGRYDNQQHTIKFHPDPNDTIPQLKPPIIIKTPTKIAVFTAKGGVGKTTVSAHLAGALALSGKNVILQDADPQNSLNQLAAQGTLEVPNQKTGGVAQLKVIKYTEPLPTGTDYNFIVSDFSPAFSLNPTELVNDIDMFICPLTLSPLAVGPNAERLKDSYEAIRSINKSAPIFILINNFPSAMHAIAIRMLAAIKIVVEKVIKDNNCHLIDPKIIAIRESNLLKNFGEYPKLEFLNVAGRCYPRQDFLALADYIVEFNNNTELTV